MDGKNEWKGWKGKKGKASIGSFLRGKRGLTIDMI